MLGLKLRDEFLGSSMPGTAIELRTSDKKGAVQKDAGYILSITYPTTDVKIALKAISEPQLGRPLVLKGERGRGKSHIMALMHHAVASPDVVESWLAGWAGRGKPELAGIKLLRGYLPISEAVHNYEYTFLWELLFARHPRGEYYKGQFELGNQPVPSRTLLENMFADQKVCLILDEFQTWFNSLPKEKNGIPIQANAFNFIQLLSEIAKDHPEKLMLAVSVLDTNNNAYTQVRRQNPIDIDFLSPEARQERQKLLLHRLFENRENIAVSGIKSTGAVYAKERIRLRFSNVSPQEKTRLKTEVFSCWPFSPELIELLEEQILVSRAAQDNRDLIKILAQVFKSRGDQCPVITPADFFVDGENDEVQTLINSIAATDNPDKLRKIAQKNLSTIVTIAPDVKNARYMISDIWMHSLFHNDSSGVDPSLLHLEITRDTPLSDNDFNVELSSLIENSTHIFGGDINVPQIKFSLEENPNSKVRSFAKNENLWAVNVSSSGAQQVYPMEDINYIRDTLHAVFSPETQTSTKIIVLGPSWRTDPWTEVKDHERPANWDRPILLVIPENIENNSREPMHTILGNWLKDNLSRRRNTIRFLLTKNSLFSDKGLVFLSRCAFLCSKKAWGQERSYNSLHHEYQTKLVTNLKSRFDRFAILYKWDYQNPARCRFETLKISAPGPGKDILKSIETDLLQNLFDRSEFKKNVMRHAKNSLFIKDIIDSLVEPPPSSGTVIPYLKEEKIADIIFEIAADGDIAINAKGVWIARRPDDENAGSALNFIRSKAAGQINVMKSYQLSLPGAAGGAPVGSAVQPGAPSLFSGSVADNGAAANTPTMPPQGRPVQPVSPQLGTMSPPPPVQIKIPRTKSSAPRSSINLIGQFESWGLSSDKTINKATLEFDGLSVFQIKQILQRIPIAYQAGLSISYDDIENSGTTKGSTGDRDE
ncbi:MAG: hypothetical protein LBH85_04395 [Treponema sp.]|jgi:hypothetical protein|nr:hypothetical protein [Treponema sp.]